MRKEVDSMSLPLKTLNCEGGYFVMADITDCIDLIPKKYLTQHEYEDPTDPNPVNKYHLNKADGTIPKDLAFCRWMAHHHRVAMMPNSFFYTLGSPNLTDKYVRMAICKKHEDTVKCIESMKSIKVEPTPRAKL